MKALFMTCLLAMVGVLNIAAQNMDILPDTWVATDALGRVMPDAEVAPLRTDKPRTVGIVLHRDHNGYGGLHYTDTTGRNDIIEATVSVTRKNVIFSVTAADNLTPSTDAHWMLLYLDTDNDASTWWEGFDFFIADGKLCRYEDPPRPLGTPPVMEGRSWRVDGSWPVVCPVKIVCEWQQPHGHRSPQGAGSHGQSLHPRLQVGRQPLRPIRHHLYLHHWRHSPQPSLPLPFPVEQIKRQGPRGSSTTNFFNGVLATSPATKRLRVLSMSWTSRQ